MKMETKIKITEFHKSSIFNLQFSFLIGLALYVPLFVITTPDNSAAQTWHTVRWVNDGDTIVLNTGQRVRYIGINAPEIDHEGQKAQPYGYPAKSFNKDLVMSKKIRLEFGAERYDRYGRTLAHVFLQDGTYVNRLLLQAGFAYYLYRKPNVQYDKILQTAQQEAMEMKKGLWRRWQEKNRPYIGNTDSRRYHISSCPFAKKIKFKNQIKFSSKWQAFSKGYAPGKKCIKEFWSYAAAE
jgi:micrococcal nuclease